MCQHDVFTGCGKRINEDYLKILVFDQIKTLINVACDQKQMAQDLLQGTQKKGRLLSLDRKITNTKKKLSDLEKTLERLYLDYEEKTIEEEEYRSFRIHYLNEKEDLLSALQEYTDTEKQEKIKLRHFLNLEQDLESFINEGELDQSAIDELIEMIYVGKDNAIEIKFKCEDVFSQFMEIMEDCHD